MSQDGSDSFAQDDGGNLLADAEASNTRDRSAGQDSTHGGHDASGTSNQLYADGFFYRP